MNPEHLHILQHSLGLDQYAQGSMYRNRYVCDPNPDTIAMLSMGWLKDCGPQEMMSNMHYYEVTDAGKIAMFAASQKPPKLTAAQRRYKAFLRADCGMTFIEWLKASAKCDRLST